MFLFSANCASYVSYAVHFETIVPPNAANLQHSGRSHAISLYEALGDIYSVRDDW